MKNLGKIEDITRAEIDAYDKIVEIVGLKKRKDGFYHTYYGKKTREGLLLTIAGIMRDMGAIKNTV